MTIYFGAPGSKDGRTSAWKVLRLAVFQRDGFRCVKCGRPGRLECDHIRPIKDGGERYAMSNLQTLCRACHFAKTAKENGKVKGRHEWGRHLSLIQGGKT